MLAFDIKDGDRDTVRRFMDSLDTQSKRRTAASPGSRPT
jgi:hypothetical protein